MDRLRRGDGGRRRTAQRGGRVRRRARRPGGPGQAGAGGAGPDAASGAVQVQGREPDVQLGLPDVVWPQAGGYPDRPAWHSLGVAGLVRQDQRRAVRIRDERPHPGRPG